jgi:hypothetical protein
MSTPLIARLVRGVENGGRARVHVNVVRRLKPSSLRSDLPLMSPPLGSAADALDGFDDRS